jgi:hypothetical protein
MGYRAAQHGSLSINGNGSNNPTIVYLPAPGFIGTDTFDYAIDDGTRIDIATVTVAVIVDADNDLVDNCLGASNNSQRDTDGDGYGNVNFADLARFKALFGKPPGPSAAAP